MVFKGSWERLEQLGLMEVPRHPHIRISVPFCSVSRYSTRITGKEKIVAGGMGAGCLRDDDK